MYFPPKEETVFRAIQALARNRGESTSKVVLGALKQWLDGQEVLGEILEAASTVDAIAYIRSMDPCRHRSFDNRGRITCKVKSGAMLASRCVECAEYDTR